jgi:hypothetical protein
MALFFEKKPGKWNCEIWKIYVTFDPWIYLTSAFLFYLSKLTRMHKVYIPV